MKKGIIFDLDGTLWDTTERITPSWNIVLKRHNLRQVTVDEMQSYMGKTLDVIAELMIPNLEHEERMKILDECCLEEQSYLRNYGGILYPNLEDTLKKLKEKYNLYIVSNCHTQYIKSFFNAHKLEEYFSDTECNGGTGLSKGENIKIVIERNNLDKAIYVGDTQGDLDATDFAEIPFVFAKYGFGSVNRKTYEINSISELVNLSDEILCEE